ncbi:YaaC family protein [Bacillus sonorensis]|uniref:YaaC family protein n=3 Tax=Bacillus sonorensis TaxID=119858 RepID=UPI000495E0F0|nr:YaaC family protein [Bacillus sonorensis]MCY7859556.1 YaaC family protein [Bacillus sonorensis]MCY8027791.1 YaaC family protein [Bacillus sonorensis]MCY8036415.1 YaaC family protein [Bacillus sonorensis]MCY8406534.1 YaaC family protein [Bacillus sonorensis]MCY8565353.1 YaaC family protein [Bacillus sonorensis]
MQNKGWKELELFYSVETAQNFLEMVYKNLGMDDAKKNSYKNGERFIFFLKHAEAFYKQAKMASIEIKPILLFYGMAQLLKACILTSDPSYPSHTSVLAHGVTTRKRKKQNYRFYEDEVKIQRNGLCMHVIQSLFQLKGLEDERFSMKQLLVNIPEINNVLSFQKRENPMVKAVLDKGCIRLPAHTADAYNMSAQRFIEHVKYHLNWVLSGKDKDWLTFSADQKEYHPSTSTSLLFDLESGTFLFPAARDRFLKLPEILIHYLIAYNLSMIARYETEWWYDLLLQCASDDYVIIQQFLHITEKKFPYYIAKLLLQKKEDNKKDQLI